MKKIYNFLALMLLFVATSWSAKAADRDWTVWEISDDQITAPQSGMYVALQQGNNASYSQNGFLNPSGAFLSTFNATCVYELIKVGTAEDGSDLFALKNVSNKQYIYYYGHTLSYSDAYQCTIKKAKADESDLRALIVGGETQPDAEGTNWVLADASLPEDGSKPYYLCYWGCPAYSPYWDTNDWKIYEATPREAAIDDKLQTIYDELFYNGFTEEEFGVGTNPGGISQELHDKIQDAYNKVNDCIGSTSVSDADKEALLKTLVEIQDKLNGDGRVKVKSGKYYMFINNRSQDAVYDNNGGLRCTQGKSALADSITLAEAKYIWTVEDAGNGQFYIQNFGTGNYVGGQSTWSSQFPSSKDKSMTFNITFIPDGSTVGEFFNVSDNNGCYWHNDGWYNVVNWYDYKSNPNLYKIVEVPDDVINQLKAVVEKNRFLTEYSNLILEAKSTTTKYNIDSDVTFDGSYDNVGLFSSFEKANASEPYEGSEANAFDGNPNTYYHTLWSSVVTDDYHWVQVNLGDEPIQKLFLKMTKRNGSGGNPLKFALVAQGEADEAEGIWTDTLYRGLAVYEYPTSYSSGIVDSTTAVLRIDLGKPVQHLRFVGIETPDNYHSAGSFGPCWHVAEFHMYKDGGDNPRYAMIPEEIRQALKDAITKAEKLAADSTATQADYDALQSAIKAFNDDYPDDSELLELISNAKSQAEAEGMVGTGWGQFPAEAQSTLAASVSEISAYVKANTPLSLSAIAEQTAKIRAAISAFNAKLIVPEDGSFVRIKCAAQSVEGEQDTQYGNYVYPNSSDSSSIIYWWFGDDENKETRLYTVWQLQKQADGKFALKNLITGRYMTNMYDGVEDKNSVDLSSYVYTSSKPSGITLVSAKKAGIFNLQLAEGIYVNADPNYNIVNWNSETHGSMFEFEPVSADIVSEGLTYTVKSGVYQVVTLPFEVSYVAPSPYKVLGQKDGKLQLALYGDDETIPAGTPFIVKPEDETSYVQVGIVAADANELINGSYVYDHIAQNGMIGTLNNMTVNAGIGLLLDNVIKNAVVNNTSVSANSGYFVEIPETTEDGDVAITIEDVINGINNAVVASNAKVSAIYTISGVKISNAKSVEGLPKGLYIVNGKKIYVK